jgi:hypothetical protein
VAERQQPGRAEQLGVSELRVPALVESPFDVYFRSLVRESLIRSAEAEYVYQRVHRHRFRARRAARVAARARSIPAGRLSAAETAPTGLAFLAVTRILWALAAAGLVCLVVMAGVRSWATGAADLVVIGLTFAWFVGAASSDGRP